MYLQQADIPHASKLASYSIFVLSVDYLLSTSDVSSIIECTIEKSSATVIDNQLCTRMYYKIIPTYATPFSQIRI